MDDIARRAAAGDDVAFARLVRTHQGKVRAFLLRMTKGNHALADDLAQDAFLEAYRKIGQFRDEGSFQGWLTRIAWSRFLMEVRKSKAETNEIDADLPAPDTRGATEARLDIERAMQHLAPGERASLTLCYAMEFSHSEAAEVLNLPVGTVKSHVARGREKLKALLQ
jgi:RNA polymerase sigma-70 factor (ECF subfamily)